MTDLLSTGLEEYADVLRSLVESVHLQGKRIVAIGHSTGSLAW